ncbi:MULTISPECIES: fluoride efflux transporter CrcB [unclassified Bacillus (in: firmicutes)]|uniref:fluoride efflux transporter CrcB n=1 Tax=unclassified Bacillus (in: firmicutes) TaxID=185979 RepID=UPI001BEB272B|nr:MULTISPECIES: fluoride efflux transporter CrcB [unclassified Bacillus (in: firmicutes)]MBT2618994.1 fluoride efflux transporter CrcB [Bacillus sp. ISL-78]MBT2630656.1 fluoride efflux transporter CrcB [Bacillus sp. ISL-101]
MKLLLVMLGGFLGTLCRYGFGIWIPTYKGFPLGTLVINLVGCLFLGWFITSVSHRKKIRPEFTFVIGTGFIGSFTTFSTFSVESIHLFQDGHVLLALLYILSTTLLGLLLAYLGCQFALPKEEEGDPV